MKISEILALREKKKETGSSSESGANGNARKKPLKVVRTRETPNPNALQFVINAQVISGGKHAWTKEEDCENDPMGLALFELDGIQSVFIAENFVTVTKTDFCGWNPLKARVWKLIDEHIRTYKVEEKEKSAPIDTANFMALSHGDKMKAVEAVLDRSIRSNLAKDGGGVDVKGIEGNEILIHYQGACGNCPSSTTGTLQFIEKQVKQQLDKELTVRSV